MNPLQQAAVRRKVGYVAAVLALFTLTLFWRGTIPVPLAAQVRSARWLASNNIFNKSAGLELRELDQGEAEVAGTAIRLGLLGSRGVVVTALWWQAIEKQKRNDFHELELLVQTVTKLQPRFVTPWIFQSWNIAYNVSVETDRLNDMFFYIGKGIQLLAEGERRNRAKNPLTDREIGSPDMRYQVGFMYRNKFGVSDKVQTLRCLFQLSCIPPNDRNPDLFRTADGGVDPAQFLAFCEKYPHLVRRLRDKLSARQPDDVVRFLADNQKVMSRYKETGEFAPRMEQFPVLPEDFGQGEANPKSEVEENFSGFGAAKAWFAYSMEMLPPNPTDDDGRPVPAATPRPGEYDPFTYRVPKSPMLIIFRQDTARTQTYIAELEQKEGWFDDTGWKVDEGADPTAAWFPGKDVVLGRKPAWSEVEWTRAYQLWARHADAYGLILSPDRLETYREQARSFPGDFRVAMDPTDEQKADGAYMRAWRAKSALFYYDQNRSVTNAPFFIISSAAEQKRETVQARKVLWQAEQARKTGDPLKAAALYKQGLEQWKKVLLDNPEFHRAERADRTEEETYEAEREYLRLIEQHEPEARKKVREVAGALHAAIPFLSDPAEPPATLTAAMKDDLTAYTAQKFYSPFAEPVPSGPWAGTPWVRKEVKSVVESRDASNRPAGAPAQSKDGK